MAATQRSAVLPSYSSGRCGTRQACNAILYSSLMRSILFPTSTLAPPCSFNVTGPVFQCNVKYGVPNTQHSSNIEVGL